MMRLHPDACLLLLSLLAATAPRATVRAQERIDLSTLPQCNTCALRVERFIQLGDEDGPGAIESEAVRVIHSDDCGGYAVFQVGGSRLQLFDSSGSFVRHIGRRGRGPGEIAQLVDAHFRGREIVLLDYRGSKLTVVDVTGAPRTDVRLSIRPGRFRITSDSTLVVGSMDMSREAAGFPLHRIIMPSGVLAGHFGSMDDGNWNAAEPFAEDVVLGWSPIPDRIWRGHRDRLQLEEWHVDGRLLRTVRGDFDWFPPLRDRDSDSGPPSFLTHFGTDGRDRLWLVVRVPDPNWREVVPQNAEGLIERQDMSDYFDTRINVFDLGERRHVGSFTWDEAYVALTQIGTDLALYRVVYDGRLVPRVGLYRVDLNDPPHERRN